MKYKSLISCVLILIMLPLSACTASENKPVKRSEFLLDTVIELTLYESKNTAEALLNDMVEIIRTGEMKYNRHTDSSEISRINSNPGSATAVSEDTLEILERSLYFSSISDGLFDVSIGPLVDLWDINGDDPHVPNEEQIASVQKKIDYRKIILDEDNLTVSISEGMSLDIGAIAKGYITDQLVSFLRENNVQRALLNLGGNLYLHGIKADGSLWKIGIRNPFGMQGEYIGTVSVRDMSVVTSGIYERFFEENGKLYHHILNPKTGYPEDNSLASVTILSPSSTLADGFSTTVFLLGPEAGMALVDNTDNAEAILITRDKRVILSQGIKNGEIPFQITNHEFKVAE